MTGPRVAVVYDCFFPLTTGGGERVYRRISELLVDRGATVDYLTRSLWSGEAPDPGFTVRGIWTGYICDAQGTRTSSSALAFALAAYRRLRRSRRDYDIVIASALPVLTLIAARLALRGSRAWLVADWLEVWTWAQWRRYAGPVTGTIASLLQNIGARCADLDTANSLFTAGRLARYGKNPLVLGLVDLAGEAVVPLAAAAPPYILFAGRHIPDKRITTLAGALASAREVIPGLRLVVAGTGPETAALKRELDRTGMAEFTDVIGRVDDAQLATVIGAAAAMVTPSLREGFGLVVAEAAAAGVPSVVVAGNDNAAVDLIEEGRNGAVARSASAEDLGSAIVRVVENASLRHSTIEWYRRQSVERGLGSSVDQILERYFAARESAAR